MHDLGEPVECRVVQLVFEDDRLEAAAAVDMPQLDATHVVRDGALALPDADHVSGGHIHELRLRVDEALDQPWARNQIDAGILSGYPLHLLTPRRCNVG